MSCNYAEGLSDYEDKGILGVPEKFDSEETLEEKCTVLYNMIASAKHIVVHTGAGISTSAGIPDFRGPNGVWTLEKRGLKPNTNISFGDAKPTPTHMALYKLVQMGIIKYIVSQNIDGLHLKSGIDRKYLAELHGNMFLEKCGACQRQFIRSAPVETVGQKSLQVRCRATRPSGSATCRGTLHDLVLDWEHNLPDDDLRMADMHSCIADLSICFGTTLQIIPSGNLPTYTLKNGGKLVIINLQPTKHDKKAHLVINSYVDKVLEKLMKRLNFDIPLYSESCDFTKCKKGEEWSMAARIMSDLKLKYKEFLRDCKLMKLARSHKRKSQSKIKHVRKKEKLEDLEQSLDIKSDNDDLNQVDKDELISTVKNEGKVSSQAHCEDIKSENNKTDDTTVVTGFDSKYAINLSKPTNSIDCSYKSKNSNIIATCNAEKISHLVFDKEVEETETRTEEIIDLVKIDLTSNSNYGNDIHKKTDSDDNIVGNLNGLTHLNCSSIKETDSGEKTVENLNGLTNLNCSSIKKQTLNESLIADFQFCDTSIKRVSA